MEPAKGHAKEKIVIRSHDLEVLQVVVVGMSHISFFCMSLCGLRIRICGGICVKIPRNTVVASTQLSMCLMVLTSLSGSGRIAKIPIQYIPR